MKTDAQRSFAERFLRDQHRLYGYIATLVPSRADAEDIFQETSLLLWEKWCEFDQDRDLLPWACGIAHNVVRNFWRKRHPAGADLSEALLERIAQARLEMEDELAPRREALTVCMERLSPAQRALVEECYRGDSQMNRLAAGKGLSSNALYLKLRRIRATLLDCINRQIGQEQA